MILEVFKKLKGAAEYLKNANRLMVFASVILSAFFTLNIMNLYAAEGNVSEYSETKVDTQQNLNETVELINLDADDDGAHSVNTNATIIGSVLTSVNVSLYPGISKNYEEIQSSNKLSPITKMGLIGAVDSGVIAMINNSPSINITNHLAQEWVPGASSSSSVLAATDGYSFLSQIGIDSLWEKSRLISYVFFVVVLIAAGFLIMFRQKVGGQMAITIFNTLPNVVLGLILVTFSFAIVGLILNFSAVLVNVVGEYIDPTGQSLISVDNPFSLLGPGLTGVVTGAGGGLLALVIPVLIGSFAGMLAAGPAGVTVVAAGIIGGALVLLLIIFAVLAIVLFASIKVYFTLLGAYLGILIDTVLAPIIIALGTIPGKEEMTWDLFRRIARNALVFPGVFLLINLGLYLLKNEVNISFPSGLTGGDIAGTGTGQGAIGVFLRAAMTVALFFLAAEVPNILLDFLPANGGKGFGAAIEGVKKSASKIPLVGSFFG